MSKDYQHLRDKFHRVSNNVAIFASRKTCVMSQEQRATEFVIFCIENTASRLGISGAEVYKELKRINGISAFLYPSYAMLHTQGKDYIVDETLQYLSRFNPEFLKTKGTKA